MKYRVLQSLIYLGNIYNINEQIEILESDISKECIDKELIEELDVEPEILKHVEKSEIEESKSVENEVIEPTESMEEEPKESKKDKVQ